MNGKSGLQWLLWIALFIISNAIYAQVPVGAPQAFVSPVVSSAQPATPTTTPEAAPTREAPAGGAPITIPPPAYTFFTAPYFGISLGPRINNNGLPALYNAFEGTLSLGVEAMLTKYLYLGGEVFLGNSLQLQNRKNYCCVKYYGNTNRIYCCPNVKSNWTYGFDIIPGILIHNVFLTYLRIGVSSTHFPGQSSSSTAWRAGLGVETIAFCSNTCKKWYIRGEYIYSSYNGMSHVGRVRANQINIGIVYKFI